MPATPAGPGVGRQAKAYLNTGTNASPVHAEAKFIKSLKLGLTKAEVALEDRESDEKAFLAGLRESNLTFEYNKRRNTVDAVFTALMDSFLNETQIQFHVMDDDITNTGAYGWKQYYQVFGLEKTQDLEAVQVYSVTMKPTYYVESSTRIEGAVHSVS